MRAALAPVFDMPIGTKLEYATPTNDMPDPRSLLEYIDTMIALCFSNEGALLGNNGFGSYALASVSEGRFLRSAPVYAERIASGLSELLHLMIRFNHPAPETIEVWPSYTFRFAGSQDASRWVADMTLLSQNRVWEWPEIVRHQAAANMGLPSDAFDNWRGDTPIAMPGGDATFVPGEAE